MVVIASSRRLAAFVGVLAVLALLAAGAAVVRPNIIYRCPCGTYTLLGMTFCTPCWASNTPCTPTRMVLR